MSILPQMAKSQMRVNSVASKVQTLQGFWASPLVSFPGWQHFPSLVSIQTEVSQQFTGAACLGSRSYLASECHHQ